MPSFDILSEIQKRADALWVSASSDIFQRAVLKHKYDPECECTWCALTKQYVTKKLHLHKEQKYLFLFGCHGDECDLLAHLDWMQEDIEILKAKRKEMKKV